MEGNRSQERIVTFQLGKETYGIPIMYVESVERNVSLTRLPRMPKDMAGVFALRKQTLPVVDLRVRLGIEATTEEGDTNQYIIVTQVEESTIGFLVDAVREVIPSDSGWIERDIALITNTPSSQYLLGVMNLSAGGFVVLLDLPNLFSPKEQESLKKIVSES